jgi:hypothetical protein
MSTPNRSRFTQVVLCSVLLVAVAIAQEPAPAWIDPGSKLSLPASMQAPDRYGTLGILNDTGIVEMEGHPFFTPLGTNGRACISCHQPAYAMSVSVLGLRDRWTVSRGRDVVFAAADGSNCPHLPQEDIASHSLLLERGLFRVALDWPPRDSAGKTIRPEFELEVVRDPTGCNLHPQYGVRSKRPMVSVYRRPRPVANLKYVVSANGAQRLLQKTGEVAAVDPESGLPQSMNLLADARWPTLQMQVQDAARVHLQRSTPLDADQLRKLVDYAMQTYVAQSADRLGGSFHGDDAPAAIGPERLARGDAAGIRTAMIDSVFGRFDQWKSSSALDAARREFRASAARGSDLFMTRRFWIRDAMHTNSLFGNPIKRTCSACHSARMTGMDTQAGWIDVGTANLPWAGESPDLPLFKVTCDAKLPPHPFLGRTIYTHDPGRALITGKCDDVGAIVMQQLRGLAARPPYFANGNAGTLREVIDFYDRRFNIGFSELEKQDLVSFLSVL